MGEGLSSVGRFSDEVFDLGIKGVIAIVIPADVDIAAWRGGGPSEKMIFLAVERVVVNAIEPRCARVEVHGGQVDAGCSFELSAGHLIGRKRAVSGMEMNATARSYGSSVPKRPVEISKPVEHETGNGFCGHHPGSGS